MTRLVILALAFFFTACGRQEEKPPPSRRRRNSTSSPRWRRLPASWKTLPATRFSLPASFPKGSIRTPSSPSRRTANFWPAADLIILNGLDLETPTLKLAQANLKQALPFYSLGDKTIKETEYIYDFSFPKEHGHPNPHLWLNPEYAMRYATLVRDELIRLDPKNKAVYEKNAAHFLKKLEALDQAIKEAAQDDPAKQPPAAHLSRLLALLLPDAMVSKSSARSSRPIFPIPVRKRSCG